MALRFCFKLLLRLLFCFEQVYAWIGCNSAKLGHMYAAATTRPVCMVITFATSLFFFGLFHLYYMLIFHVLYQNNMVSVTSILGGTADNTGASIARRLGNAVVMFVVLTQF